MTRALISVSDKSGIVDLAKSFVAEGIEILSTGGTQKVLEKAGLSVISVESVTGFPEMMDGRVKTLHPKIHGALLGLRDRKDHLQAMEDHQIVPIDYVVVNLYPFKETLANPQSTLSDAIENIDIGGPSMIRSAAKNYASVTVVTDPDDYALIQESLKEKGETDLELRARLAAKAFRHTAQYDALIAQYLTREVGEEQPESLTLTYQLKQSLRYGENSHQQAQFYEELLPVAFSLTQAIQIQGKELSYNNIKDADAALRMIAEFKEPTAIALKHMNPCGVGKADTIEQAFEYCFEADPTSIYGGIVVVNRPVTKALAQLLRPIFLEIVIAPSFDSEALEILSQKKNLRVMALSGFKEGIQPAKEYVSVMGGLLVQDQDIPQEENETFQAMGEKEADSDLREALAFAWKVVKHVKSNAIVVTNAYQTLGIGAGQMNRVGACKIAIEEAGQHMKQEDHSPMVLASDAFLPMRDTAAYACAHGIQAIIQPGGSIHDEDSIEEVDQAGIPMLKTGIRHFRH